MGKEYFPRAVGFGKGFSVPVNTITLSSAAQTAQGYGVNLVTYASSGVANDLILPDPPAVGNVMQIVLDNNTTSAEANINTNSTGQVFWGTTFNTVTVATTGGDGLISLELTAATTASWAVTGISSTAQWTFSATTGSTGTA